MKNSQVAVICLAILAGALIITAGNYVLVRSIQPERPAPSGRDAIAIDHRGQSRRQGRKRSPPAGRSRWR